MKLVKKQSFYPFGIVFSIFGFFGVALGAFAAHALKSQLSPESMAIFETGNRYHMIHTLALGFAFFFGYLNVKESGEQENFHSLWYFRACFCFSLGILIFSSSLYILAITGWKILGAITPFGGVLFLLGWICLGVANYRLFVPKK